MSRSKEGVRAFALRNLRSPAAPFAGAMYLSLALNLVQGVLFARLLGLSDYGVWQQLLLLLNYGQHFHLGSVHSVNRQLPLLRGQGRTEEARAVAANARGMIVLATLGWFVLGAFAIAAFYRGNVLGASVFVFLVAVEGWWMLGQAELNTAERFFAAGSVTVFRNALNVVLLILVARWGLEGAYFRWALVLAASLFFLWRANPVRAPIRFSSTGMRQMLSDGGPILIVGALFSIQTSLDRTLLFFMRDAETMGRYGVAAILMALMVVLPGAVGQTSYPRMLEQFGREGVVSALWPGVWSRVKLVGALSVGAAAAGALALPFAVRWILPDYVEGVRAAQWLLPGGVFVAASLPCSYYMQVIRRQGLLAVLNLIALSLQGILGYVVLSRGGDIEALAMATSVGLAIYGVIIVATGARLGRAE